MLYAFEIDRDHAVIHSELLREYGERFVSTGKADVRSEVEADWPHIDADFQWAAAAAGVESAEARLAAEICISFVSKESLWPLTLWRPPAEALDWLFKAHEAATRLEDYKSVASILNSLGIVQLAMGKPLEALASHQEAERIANQHGHTAEATHAAASFGICYRHLGRRKEALEANRHALVMAEAGGFEGLSLNCLGNTASVLAEMKDFTAAIEGFEKALFLARKLNRKREEGYALGNLGHAHYDLGNLEQAEHYIRQDLDLAIELRNDRGIANAKGNLGNVHIKAGRVSEGLACHYEQLQIAERLGQPRELAIAYINVAVSLVRSNRTDEALRNFDRGMAIHRDINNRVMQSEAHHRIAGAFQAVDDKASADRHLEHAKQLDDAP